MLWRNAFDLFKADSANDDLVLHLAHDPSQPTLLASPRATSDHEAQGVVALQQALSQQVSPCRQCAPRHKTRFRLAASIRAIFNCDKAASAANVASAAKLLGVPRPDCFLSGLLKATRRAASSCRLKRSPGGTPGDLVIIIDKWLNRRESALSSRAISLAHPHLLYIGGEWIAPLCEERIEVRDSASEEVIAVVAKGNAADMDRAVEAARRAFDEGEWPRLTPQKRAGFMRDLAAAILRRGDEFARCWTLESGVLYSISSARTAALMSSLFLNYAELADTFAFQEPRRAMGGQQAWLVREPVGVVGAIVPWNSPAALTTYKVAPALLAGCTIVIKTPTEAPCSGFIFAEICEEIGLPPGVINVVPSNRDGSRALVADPRVDKVTFTGSTEVGRDIASTLGQRIGRCTLELGGKSPAIILDDYDLAAAAQTLAGSTCMNAGQVCHSLTRIIVPRHRHDATVEALSAACSGRVIGDPFDALSDIGPLATHRQRENVARYVAIGKAEGATLACGGKRPEGLKKGYYFEPTVFGNVDNLSTIGQEEIFGPVLSVIPAADEADAIRLANQTIYGLNATIFTNDEERFLALAPLIRSGTVGQNASRTDVTIAFGGMKQSGLGREGGVDGLLPFLESKVVVVDRPCHVTTD